MNFDLSGTVAAFGDTAITVTRPVTTWGTDGRASETSSTFTAQVLALPARRSARGELQGDLPVGSVELYSAARLRENDTLTIGGVGYQVESVAGYEATGNFCVALARRVP